MCHVVIGYLVDAEPNCSQDYLDLANASVCYRNGRFWTNVCGIVAHQDFPLSWTNGRDVCTLSLSLSKKKRVNNAHVFEGEQGGVY